MIDGMTIMVVQQPPSSHPKILSAMFIVVSISGGFADNQALVIEKFQETPGFLSFSSLTFEEQLMIKSLN